MQDNLSISEKEETSNSVKLHIHLVSPLQLLTKSLSSQVSKTSCNSVNALSNDGTAGAEIGIWTL